MLPAKGPGILQVQEDDQTSLPVSLAASLDTAPLTWCVPRRHHGQACPRQSPERCVAQGCADGTARHMLQGKVVTKTMIMQTRTFYDTSL